MADATAPGLASPQPAPRRVLLTVLDRFVLRVAFGATLAFAIAMILDWKYSFLGPLLTAVQLIAIQANPRFVQGIVIPLAAIVFCNAALFAAYLFAGAPHVLLLVAALVLCWTFYLHRRGVPHILMIIAQVAVAIVPVFAMTSLEVAREFTDFFQRGCIAAAASVWIAHALIPAPPSAAAPPPPVRLPPNVAARVAFCDTVIVMPLIARFMLASDTDNTVLIATSLIILGQVDPTAQRRDAYNRLFGQFLGGLIAVVTQQFVFLADTLTQFLVTVFLSVLWLTRRVVRAGPGAGLFVQAVSGFILVVGLGVVDGGSEEYYGIRLIKIGMAILYTYGCLVLLFPLRQVREPEASPSAPATSAID